MLSNRAFAGRMPSPSCSTLGSPHEGVICPECQLLLGLMAIFLGLGQQRVTGVPCASPQCSVPSVLFMGSLYPMPTQQAGGHCLESQTHGKEVPLLWFVNRCIQGGDCFPSETATTQSRQVSYILVLPS